MHRILTMLVFAFVAVATACSGASTDASGTSTGGSGGPIDGTSWRLTAYVSSGTMIDVAEGYIVDATFENGTVSGFSGCNTYTAQTTISGSTLTVGPIATSGRLCKMAIPIEQDYLAALALAATYTATADSLAIFGADGTRLLGYVPAPADPLEGAWTVTGFNDGADAFVSPAAGSTMTVTFTPDGQVSGSSGCNDFTGTYTLDGTTLSVTQMSSTAKACEDVRMAQEAQFLAALQTPTTVETSGANVTLRDANGTMQVGLTPQ